MDRRPDEHDEALEQAIAWHQALAREDADWDGFTAWLEADRRHRALFDELALLDRAVDERRLQIEALLPAAPATTSGDRARRWWWAGGAAAAVLAAACVLPVVERAPADIAYATASGDMRRVTFGNGETVELAPRSRLIVRGGNSKDLALVEGAAFFSLRHDPSRRVNVQAGGLAISDIGTRFGIGLAGDSTTVAVAEGGLSVSADGRPATRLRSGEQVTGRAGEISAVKHVSVASVASWRAGRLVYDNTPLRLVAADLARYSGAKVTVEPSLRDQPFSGVLSIGDGSRLFDDISAIMGIGYRVDGHGVRLVDGRSR